MFLFLIVLHERVYVESLDSNSEVLLKLVEKVVKNFLFNTVL